MTSRLGSTAVSLDAHCLSDTQLARPRPVSLLISFSDVYLVLNILMLYDDVKYAASSRSMPPETASLAGTVRSPACLIRPPARTPKRMCQMSFL